MFEETKGVIRIRKSKKNRQHNACPKENVQKDKQRSTKHTHKTKDQVTRIPLKNGGEINVKILQVWKLITFDTYIF